MRRKRDHAAEYRRRLELKAERELAAANERADEFEELIVTEGFECEPDTVGLRWQHVVLIVAALVALVVLSIVRL